MLSAMGSTQTTSETRLRPESCGSGRVPAAPDRPDQADRAEAEGVGRRQRGETAALHGNTKTGQLHAQLGQARHRPAANCQGMCV